MTLAQQVQSDLAQPFGDWQELAVIGGVTVFCVGEMPADSDRFVIEGLLPESDVTLHVKQSDIAQPQEGTTVSYRRKGYKVSKTTDTLDTWIIACKAPR